MHTLFRHSLFVTTHITTIVNHKHLIISTRLITIFSKPGHLTLYAPNWLRNECDSRDKTEKFKGKFHLDKQIPISIGLLLWQNWYWSAEGCQRRHKVSKCSRRGSKSKTWFLYQTVVCIISKPFSLVGRRRTWPRFNTQCPKQPHVHRIKLYVSCRNINLFVILLQLIDKVRVFRDFLDLQVFKSSRSLRTNF